MTPTGRKARAQTSMVLGIRGERVAPGAHIAFLWETESEFADAVGFLEVGVRDGDLLVVFGHDEANARVLRLLDRKGTDLDDLQSAGRLDVLGPGTTGGGRLQSNPFHRPLEPSTP